MEAHVPPINEAPGQRTRRWGVLLAGGDGAQLGKLTRLICGDDRPKQFCPLFGDETLVEKARQRAMRSISQEQILIPLTRGHQTFYLQETGILPAQRIIQPANKGTAPPILYSLLSIEQKDHEAIVAILPCDHHYSDEPLFTAALEYAFDIAALHSGSLVILGEPPRGPEVEYGWIEPGPSVHGVGGTSFRVERFCEKPSFDIAMDLLRRGWLWNTFVMVGHVQGFLEIVNVPLANVVDEFRGNHLWAGSEVHIQDSLYERIPSIDFSQEVLVAQTPRLIVLRMVRSGWSDLGHPERVMAALQTAGLEPWWMKKWQALTHSLMLNGLQKK
jgi:mannose-1-phosphate guanylyltransferase